MIVLINPFKLNEKRVEPARLIITIIKYATSQISAFVNSSFSPFLNKIFIMVSIATNTAINPI